MRRVSMVRTGPVSRNAFWMAAIVPIAFAMAGIPRAARADEIRIGGTGAGLGTMQMLADGYAKSHPDTRFTILPSLGSPGGIKAVAAGAVQVGVSSRDLNEAERKLGVVSVEYGRTPFAFVTSASNKVTGFTLSQLVDIYSGKVEQWPDGTRIRIVLRPLSDADGEAIRSMSPEMRQAKTLAEKRPGMPFAATDQDNADSLEKVAGALGAMSLAQIITESRQIKALALDGIQPTPANIANGSYRYVKSMFLITGAKITPPAQQFVAYVQSPAGREILRRSGYWVR